MADFESPSPAMVAALRAAGSVTALAHICDVPINVVSVAKQTGHMTPKMAMRCVAYLKMDPLDVAPYFFEKRAPADEVEAA